MMQSTTGDGMATCSFCHTVYYLSLGHICPNAINIPSVFQSPPISLMGMSVTVSNLDVANKEKRIKELEDAITSALETLGEEGKCDAHKCDGCAYEHNEAVCALKEVMGAQTVNELTERIADGNIK